MVGKRNTPSALHGTLPVFLSWTVSLGPLGALETEMQTRVG